MWNDHDGGPNPIPGAVAHSFELRFRDGEEVHSYFPSDEWYWQHRTIAPDQQIVAYRIIANAVSNIPLRSELAYA